MTKNNLVLSGLENIDNFNPKENYFVFGDWVSQRPENDKIIYYEFKDEEHFKLEQQHKYISNIYQKILKKLTFVLNNFHNESMSERQWEVVIGHWLKLYLDSIFVRWKLVKNSLNEDWNVIYVLDMNISSSLIIPNSRNDFADLVTNSAKWNQLILSEIAVKYLSNGKKNIIPVRPKKIENERESVNKKHNLFHIEIFVAFLKKIMKFFILKVSTFFSTTNGIVVSSPYIGFKSELMVGRKIAAIPSIYRGIDTKTLINFNDINKRDILRVNIDDKDKFVKCAMELLAIQFPSCYFESWKGLKKISNNLNLPKNPKVIYAGSSSSPDDVFRTYISQQIGLGCKYVISQHGGVYGVTVIPPKAEFVELRVVDKWISWGWSYNDNPKIIRGFNVKCNMKDNLIPDLKGMLLLSIPAVEFSPSRIVYSNPLEIINQHKIFLSNIDIKLHKDVLIRPAPIHINHQYWKNISKGFASSSKGNFYNDLRRSRLFVCTSNSTTLLESLFLNFPTIIFLPHTEALIRREAMPFFNELKNAGVLFTDARLAAAKVSEVWNDVDNWWNKTSVQNARRNFCYQYSNKSKSPIRDLSNYIKSA